MNKLTHAWGATAVVLVLVGALSPVPARAGILMHLLLDGTLVHEVEAHPKLRHDLKRAKAYLVQKYRLYREHHPRPTAAGSTAGLRAAARSLFPPTSKTK